MKSVSVAEADAVEPVTRMLGPSVVCQPAAVLGRRHHHHHRCCTTLNIVISWSLRCLFIASATFMLLLLPTYVNSTKSYLSNDGEKDRLHFLVEPESVWASADGRRVTFKCVAAPSQAIIKWLLNGTIIQNDDSFESIKMEKNKLSIKLHVMKHTYDDDDIEEQGNGNVRNDHKHGSTAPALNINLQGAVFQCLAELNDQVIVSQPAKLIIAELSPFEPQPDRNISAIAGNNLVIPCQLPHSIPFAVAEFEFNNLTISNNNNTNDHYRILPSGNLLITNVRPYDSGSYRCIAHNPFLQEKMYADHLVYLKVFKPKHVNSDLKRLKFLLQPKERITAIIGSNITLECVAHGHPIPKISWTKVNGDMPKTRSFYDNGIMAMTAIQKEDEGIYACGAFNSKMTLEATTELRVYEMPQIIDDEYEMVEMEKGQNYELHCNAKGQPKPLISWLHNGYFIDSQITNDVYFEQENTILKIVNANPQLHAGIFQCFATNELGTTYAIKVIQFKSTVVDMNNSDSFIQDEKSNFDKSDCPEPYPAFSEDSDRSVPARKASKKKNKNKDLELIPPSKPEVSKLNDDSVMVRWHVSKSTGLPITFFKVQYKEMGKGDWNTVDVDIPPHIFSYPVCCLNPNATYRFRIAAVYSNDDNKNSKSTKFDLQKDPRVRRPTNPPTIVNGTAVSPYEIFVEWEFLNIDMQPIDGFFINYRATESAGQYLMITAMGSATRRQNISFLRPDTPYEIKMQCFNEAGTSPFSNIYTVKTLPLPPGATEDVPESPKMPTEEDPTKPMFDREQMQLVVILVVTIMAALFVMTCVLVVICCMRQKSSQSPKIKKEKVIKPTSDYYFTSANIYDRRLSSNGQINSIANGGSHHMNHNDPTTETESDHTTNAPMNDVPLLNRRNSFRNSLNFSSHHLYSSNNNIKSPLPPVAAAAAANDHPNDNSTATIDRKRPLKNSLPGPYLDLPPRMNHHSASFTRLNGTLERKRRSRNDLNNIDKPSPYYHHPNNGRHHNVSQTDLNLHPNGNVGGYQYHSPMANNNQPNGQFVIMQSSC